MDLLKLLGLSKGKQQPPVRGPQFPSPGFYEQAVQGRVGYPGGQPPAPETGGLQVRPNAGMQNNPSGDGVFPQAQGSWPNLQNGGNDLQGFNQDDLSTGIQGGTVNQGFTPLQGSYGNDPIQIIRRLLGR